MPDQNTIDMLLRESAQTENAALPFELWKQELMQKVHAGAQAAPVDELGEKRRARQTRLRRATIAVAGMAAALLILLGTNAFRLGFSSMPPKSEALPEAVQFTQEEAPFPAQAPAAMQAPEEAAQNEMPLPESTRSSAGGGLPADTQSGENGMYDSALLSGEQQAIAAVCAALAGSAPALQTINAAAVRVENTSYTVIDLLVGAKQSVTLEQAYVVTLDTSATEAPAYLVDALDMRVLGTVVE